MTIQFSDDDQSQPTDLRFSSSRNSPPRKRNSSLLAGEETAQDARLESSIRPTRLAEYVGQSALKDNLTVALQAAQGREEALDHVLLYGPPGLGKTTLAMALAKEMNAEIYVTAAPALERPRDIVGLLMGLPAGAFLFVDEIHRLNRVTEEILYPAMEDFTLDRTVGKGPTARVLRVPLPRFTLVGATTKAGALSSPLRDRFGLVFRLNFYTPEELTAIIERSAGILSVPITQEAAQLLASRARGTPRIANRLLRRVRDVATVHHGPQALVVPAIVHQALEMLHIDALGLDATDRQLLRLMVETFHGRPVGLDTLATALGEDSRTVEDVYEPFLLQSGLIQRTARGRIPTPSACAHLGLSVPAPLAQFLNPTAGLPSLSSHPGREAWPCQKQTHVAFDGQTSLWSNANVTRPLEENADE